MIISTIVVVVLFALNKFSLTQTQTIKGTVRLETVNEDLSEMKNDIKESNREVVNKLDEVIRKQDNHDWRLGLLEKELTIIREKKIGTLEMELNDLRNHKTRIKWLEDEIRELKVTRHRNGGEKSPV